MKMSYENMEVQKICGICGDKALGYNFNALTCESCKAFFRRNALRNKAFRCITAGNCVLNPKTRKYCRKCRLEKCFQIGMKKDWILTEEEKIMKRRNHRNRDSEKKDADSSSSSMMMMNCNSPDMTNSTTTTTTTSTTTNQLKINGNGTNFNDGTTTTTTTTTNLTNETNTSKMNANQNNIIILPILPLSLGNNNGNTNETLANDLISSLNKNEIINYINSKLNLNLDNVNIETINDKMSNQSTNSTNSAIIVYSNQTNSNHEPSSSSSSSTSSSSSSIRDSSDNISNCSSTNGTFNNSSSTTIGNDIIGSNEMKTSSKNIIVATKSYPNMIGSDLVQSESNNPLTWKISDNVYKHAIRLEYTTNPLAYELSETDHDGRSLRKLNKLEENRLDEINRYLRPLCTYVQDNKAKRRFLIDMAEGFQCFEYVIKQIIIAVKNIQSFKCMCQDDQIALLKGSVGEIKSLLKIRYFNPYEDMYCIPNPNEQNSSLVIDHSYLKKAYGEELYNRCKNFFLSFRPDWKDDDSIISLMSMILLFYPNRANLLHREYIMLEYLTYCHLLQRYLEVKYNSVCEAKTIYLNLLSRLEEMHDLNEQCMELILKLADPKYIGPLTVELYDLNNRERSAANITDDSIPKTEPIETINSTIQTSNNINATIPT